MEFTILQRRIHILLGSTMLMGGIVFAPAASATAPEREWRNIYPDYNTASPAPAGEIAAPLSSVTPADGQEPPVDLIAERLEHDESTQIVTASGNVELLQSGRKLTADKVAYNLKSEQVEASGNVVLTETDGTQYFADNVELTGDMKDGFVEGLQILLTDGSRFGAQSGTRRGGTVLEMKQASYTPCEPCKEDPSRAPLWQLRAAKVTHDEESKMISYRDAWFEFAGVPLLYTPYFTHPDGSEDQKSGFLAPSAGYDSDLGLGYEQNYYWAIAPDKDATIGSKVYTRVNPVLLGEYRQRFENAEMALGGSATYSKRKEYSNGVSSWTDEEARGHIEGQGLWNMNDVWRSGYRLSVASDEQYLDEYDLDSEDVLENEIYAERLEGRNYTVGRVMAFQDLRISSRRVEQPWVLPEVVASFYGAPNETLGGRWNAQISAQGLFRDGSGQDVGRSSLELGWQKRYVTGWGLVNTWDGLLRGDVYALNDRSNFAGGGSYEDTQARSFAQANWNVSYPFEKRFDAAQMVVEPIVSLTAGTNVDFDDGIPNEDSRDFTLDPTNLFESDRSPGYDLIEDRTRVTYGVRTGLYGDNGYRGEVFLGQSRRFEDDDNPFYTGSGLSDQNSDYVGQMTANLGDHLDLDYRFQLENSNLTSQRHELDGTFSWERLTLNTRYFYANGLDGSDLSETREQIMQGVNLRLADEWYAGGNVWYDFGEDQGLRRSTAYLTYVGQCLDFTLGAERNNTRASSGDSGTQLMLRLGLKNLGEFQSSGISLGDGGGDDDDEDATRPAN